jgi:hypothetical protein
MRPKIVFAVLTFAALVIVAVVLLKQHSQTQIPVVAVAPVATNAPVPAPVPVPVIVKTMTPEERQAAIDAEKDRLSEWQMNSDSQSLSNILGDLVSPEKEIREAAIEATKQFGSTNAIPVLKALAANTTDNQEAIEMLEAADFIALPDAMLVKHSDAPLTPEQQQRRARAEARRQAQMQSRQGGKQNSQTPSSPGQNPSPQSSTQP